MLGIENTSGAIKAGENHQTEELSNARNDFAPDNNDGKNFNDVKHCKTLSEISINSSEMQSQKNSVLYQSQDLKRLANKWKKCEIIKGTKK